MKTKIITFNVKTAKKIQAGEIKGRIMTKNNLAARIVCYDAKGVDEELLVGLVKCKSGFEFLSFYDKEGKSMMDERDNLVLEVQDNEPQFKPFDRVLVRMTVNDTWCCDFFSHMNGDTYVCICDAFTFCIPYEGNEHLVGTTNKPN